MKSSLNKKQLRELHSCIKKWEKNIGFTQDLSTNLHEFASDAFIECCNPSKELSKRVMDYVYNPKHVKVVPFCRAVKHDKVMSLDVFDALENSKFVNQQWRVPIDIESLPILDKLKGKLCVN